MDSTRLQRFHAARERAEGFARCEFTLRVAGN